MNSLLNLINAGKLINVPSTDKKCLLHEPRLSIDTKGTSQKSVKIYNVFTAGYFLLYILVGMFDEEKIKHLMIHVGAVCP